MREPNRPQYSLKCPSVVVRIKTRLSVLGAVLPYAHKVDPVLLFFPRCSSTGIRIPTRMAKSKVISQLITPCPCTIKLYENVTMMLTMKVTTKVRVNSLAYFLKFIFESPLMRFCCGDLQLKKSPLPNHYLTNSIFLTFPNLPDVI
jgi:hypothetical protein